ncbi:hypothetical protein BJ508DRAFT_150231 [Ascobolus immersus RN42]|uniref:Uncharacterized protein n=1 Tax=Ascobolus immersus RN42 TaxID=1160509 RepID=A0A3N4HYT0_ASCIM|nr:hypothetical protein BJ508DRAFT_150231 [Ascobolus immersus RN42]
MVFTNESHWNSTRRGNISAYSYAPSLPPFVRIRLLSFLRAKIQPPNEIPLAKRSRIVVRRPWCIIACFVVVGVRIRDSGPLAL